MSEKKDKQKSSLAVSPIPLALTGLEPTDAPVDVVSVLLFEIGGEAFGIGVEHTEGVVDCPRVTPLPSAPDGIIGIASVRGRMTLVMDCSLAANPDDGKRRLILLKGESQLGLLAERVEGVIALDPDKINKRKGDDKAAPAAETRWAAPAHFQYDGRRVPLLDAARLAEV
ncbi:MAG TPA: chemotaxis protein CheW [Blastocatellia bacterium]|nr:chemotaxis protein CheW [Blastocatellia bacterium]